MIQDLPTGRRNLISAHSKLASVLSWRHAKESYYETCSEEEMKIKTESGSPILYAKPSVLPAKNTHNGI